MKPFDGGLRSRPPARRTAGVKTNAVRLIALVFAPSVRCEPPLAAPSNGLRSWWPWWPVRDGENCRESGRRTGRRIPRRTVRQFLEVRANDEALTEVLRILDERRHDEP